jgi:hypothetical protein
MNSDEGRVFGRRLVLWWWVAVAASAPLYLRLLWEQTALTWQRGPQMVGFSLAHQHPEVLFIGLAGYVGMMAWLIAAGVSTLRRRSLPQGVQLAYLVVALVGVLVAFVPYEIWAGLGGVTVNR